MRSRDPNIDDLSNVDLLYRLAPIGIGFSFVFSFVFAYVIAPVAPRRELLAWLAACVVVAILRLCFVWRYLRLAPTPAAQKGWERGFILLAAVTASLWGLCAILFFPADQPVYQMYTFVMLAGMGSGAVATMASVPYCYRIYLLCSLVPLIVRLLMLGGEVYFVLGLLTILFMATLVIVSREFYSRIHEARRARQEERYRREAMELLAKGAPLPQILRAIVIGVEEQDEGAIGSILLLDRDRQSIRHGAAPHLPGFYNEAIEGEPIGPAVGSCGTAMHLGQRVIVEDIRSHPYWVNYRALAERAGLRSCWSEPIKSVSGEVLGAFAIYRRIAAAPSAADIRRIDIAAYLAGLAIERRRSEEEHELAALVYRNSSEGMVVTDAEERVIAVNEAFTAISGYTLEDLRGRGMEFSGRKASDVEEYRRMMEDVRASGHWNGVLWNRRKNGERFACRVAINSTFSAEGALNRRVMLISDITEQKRNEELIWRQANYDSLLGLPNRRLFRDRLEQEVKKAHRAGLRMGLLFLDLDHFKEVNDKLGHDVGDALLIEAARRISTCVRESDTVARLGGDEFTVILSEIEDHSIIERVAASLIEQMGLVFELGGELAHVGVSVGITVYPDDSLTVDELLRNADLAMYAAKNGGRNRFSYFTSAAQQVAQQRAQMISDLQPALAEGQLRLCYQPIVDLRTQRICKAEALLRWHHPRLGMVDPTQFIPRAEESAQINEIGEWVFREVARVAKRWAVLAGDDFQVSLNVSPVQLRANNACADWFEHMRDISLSGRNIAIEITEGLLLESTPRVVELMRQFKEGGIQIAIDDFGTGYSSLSYLKRFELDYLKIDQSFVRDLDTDSADRAMAETIVLVGHRLGLRVVAEGVESEQQHRILAEAGCDYAQGFLFSQPLPESGLEALLVAAGRAAQA